MIADSPYRNGEPLLIPAEGALAGAAAALCMLPVLSALHPAPGQSAADLLVRIAHLTVPRSAAMGSGALVLAGGIVHALVGSLLGILYAVSQDRAASRTLVTVGLFYGLVVWVGSRVITGWVFGPVLRTTLHSYAWLLACLLYGALLGGYAAWIDRRRPREAHAVPVD